MKPIQYLFVVLAAAISMSCDKQKAAINESNKATKDDINMRKAEVDASAKDATHQADATATIDKARIEANKESLQAQLDADKKKADALAESEKARVDAEKK
jgi:hypothetical protein